MTIDELNTKLRDRFPEDKLGPFVIKFTGWKVSNPFQDYHKNNPMKWHLCTSQFWAWATDGSRVSLEATLTMSEIVLKEDANLDKIISMVELHRQYIRHMIGAQVALEHQR